MSGQWVPSRYNYKTKADKDTALLYNSYSGAVAAVGEGELTAAADAVTARMCESGFLVSENTDELHSAASLHKELKEARMAHLVIMPTEACNLRCVYCYQDFSRGAMGRGIIDGLKAYVHEAAERIDHLSVSWYGGEPLLAAETIVELSQAFKTSCESAGIGYSADMSTNGYLLTRERLAQLLDLHVQRFMVTLDGAGSVHDRRRKLEGQGGGGTYERIMSHLSEIRKLERPFQIDLRVNFDNENVEEVPELLERLSELFGGDDRFQLLVRPVGRWGGPHNDTIPVCARTAADTHLWELALQGVQRGLALSGTIADSLKPSGSVCYAAMPQSFVVGSDGQLYKCTLALHDELNKVGRLYENGRVELDAAKISLWTDSGEEQDAVCRACFFRPSCQGNHCPLYRMQTGRRPCPHEKRNLSRVLKLIWRDAGQCEARGK